MSDGKATIADGGDRAIVFCARGSVAISDGEERLALSPHDAALVDGLPRSRRRAAAQPRFTSSG